MFHYSYNNFHQCIPYNQVLCSNVRHNALVLCIVRVLAFLPVFLIVITFIFDHKEYRNWISRSVPPPWDCSKFDGIEIFFKQYEFYQQYEHYPFIYFHFSIVVITILGINYVFAISYCITRTITFPQFILSPVFLLMIQCHRKNEEYLLDAQCIELM